MEFMCSQNKILFKGILFFGISLKEIFYFILNCFGQKVHNLHQEYVHKQVSNLGCV